jgi:hypothetical protein
LVKKYLACDPLLIFVGKGDDRDRMQIRLMVGARCGIDGHDFAARIGIIVGFVIDIVESHSPRARVG